MHDNNPIFELNEVQKINKLEEFLVLIEKI
jgi:hypothetical protein